MSDYDFGSPQENGLGKQLEAGAKVIQLDGTAGTSTDSNRSQGMIDGLKSTCPDAEIVANAKCGWDYATANLL